MAILCFRRGCRVSNFVSRLATAAVFLFFVSSAHADTVAATKSLSQTGTLGTCLNAGSDLTNNGKISFSTCEQYKLGIAQKAYPTASNFYIDSVDTSGSTYTFITMYVLNGTTKSYSKSSFTPSAATYTYTCPAGYQLSDSSGNFTDSGTYCTLNACASQKGQTYKLWVNPSNVPNSVCFDSCEATTNVAISFPTSVNPYESRDYQLTGVPCTASDNAGLYVPEATADAANAHASLVTTATAACGSGNFEIYTDNVAGQSVSTYYCFSSPSSASSATATTTTSGATSTTTAASSATSTASSAGSTDSSGSGSGTSSTTGSGSTSTTGTGGTTSSSSGSSTGSGSGSTTTSTTTTTTVPATTSASSTSNSDSLESTGDIPLISSDAISKDSFDVRSYFTLGSGWLPRSCPSFDYLKFSVPSQLGGRTYDLSAQMPRLCDFMSGVVSPLSQIIAALVFMRIVFARRD